MQDAFYKQHSGMLLELKIEATSSIMSNSHQVLKGYESNHIVNISYLEAVAGMRFSLMEVATLLHTMQNLTVSQTRLAVRLLQITEEVCTDPVINTIKFAVEDVVGPAVYFLKLLVRQYGFDFLRKISEKYQWAVPEGIRRTNKVS